MGGGFGEGSGSKMNAKVTKSRAVWDNSVDTPGADLR